MWNLPRPGIKPMSPTLADKLLTTTPPVKSKSFYFNKVQLNIFLSWVTIMSKHNENSVHRNDTVASTHCNWRKTCINEDWAQPKIKINNIKKKKKNKRNVVGQVNWSDISTLAIICLYLCLSLQRKAPWGQEPFLICICNYCILLREVRYSHPSVHLPCYCLSLSRPHQPRYCFRV